MLQTLATLLMVFENGANSLFQSDFRTRSSIIFGTPVHICNFYRKKEIYFSIKQSFVRYSHRGISNVKLQLAPGTSDDDLDVFLSEDSDSFVPPFESFGNGESAINSTIPNSSVIIPPPLKDNIVDVNLERRAVVYEVEVGRDLGFEIIAGPSDNSAIVGQVFPGSRAESLGLQRGDLIVATSATAGDQMWSHDSVDSVRSALSTRFVMSASVRMRLERALASIPPSLVPLLRVPSLSTVKLKRPIGLHVVEGPQKAVYVQYIKPSLGAARSRRVAVGDQIVAMSASWGDRMWEVTSVEAFVVGVRMRSDSQLSFRLRRLVPLSVYCGQVAGRQQRLLVKQASSADPSFPTSAKNTVWVDSPNPNPNPDGSLLARVEAIKTKAELARFWQQYKALHCSAAASRSGQRDGMTAFIANRVMSLALQLEMPELAADLFESVFGFEALANPAASALRLFRDDSESRESWASVALTSPSPEGSSEGSESRLVRPNNFVCTTAAKAYGRLFRVDEALALLPWLEDRVQEPADVYLMSTLLYVCAKAKRVREAEALFWKAIPARNLSYTVATANSLMYMYAKLNRPDDALRVYELIKRTGLKCTVVTYGILIKALMRSGQRTLQDTAFEILRSLPGLGIHPGVEVYNQIFEYYARTHDYKQAKAVLRLMALSKPRVKLDAVSYGYLITCFADSKKPRSALSAFHQMRKQRIAPSRHAYMGVLKALAHMRDGLSAVQVVSEMHETGMRPDKRHYSMAMFACVVADQCELAESIIALYLRQGLVPDVALCSLWLRALLQQGKWAEGDELLRRMRTGEYAKPNQQTLNYLLQYQIQAEKWSEALATLRGLLDGCSQSAGGLHGTVSALSFALGVYSSQVTRMYREDFGSIQYKNSDEFAEDVTIDEPQAPVTPPLSTQANAIGRLIRDNNLGVLGLVPDAIPQSPERDLPPPTQLVGRTPTRPSAAALRFLVQAVQLIGGHDKLSLPGDFYIELLKGLIVEGQPAQAKILLDLRDQGLLRIKVDEKNKLSNIESLASRAIREGLIAQK
mmetsp:Transcript_31628/g.45553  ORF Transcript_31628/g.45553 Transcript_31628/m.45553 type:complete len:1038 (+) Transcript_31628:41-3154(+)